MAEPHCDKKLRSLGWRWTLELKSDAGIQRVRFPLGQGETTSAGSECCVDEGQPRLRSVHSEEVSRATEPRNILL